MSARQLTFVAAMLVMASVGAVVAAARVSSQGLSSHTLLGTVTDTSRQPLAGAVVELSLPASTGSVRTVTTGDDGKYRFERIVPGLYVLTVRLPRFGSAIRDLELGDGGDAFEFDVQLQPLRGDGPNTVPLPAVPDRRVVCGLTIITPRNVDPKIVIPRQPPQSAIPFNDRTPGPPKLQDVPQPQMKGTMRAIQPTMCWEPSPAERAPAR